MVDLILNISVTTPNNTLRTIKVAKRQVTDTFKKPCPILL